jgi:hypothetical protein
MGADDFSTLQAIYEYIIEIHGDAITDPEKKFLWDGEAPVRFHVLAL